MGSAPDTPTAMTRSPGMTRIPSFPIFGIRDSNPLPPKNLWWDRAEPTEKSPGAGCESQQTERSWEEKRKKRKEGRKQQCPQRDSSHGASSPTLWKFMENPGKHNGATSNPWKFMENHGNTAGQPQTPGNSWRTMETRWGNLKPLEIHGEPRETQQDLNPLQIMEIHGNTTGQPQPPGNPWKTEGNKTGDSHPKPGLLWLGIPRHPGIVHPSRAPGCEEIPVSSLWRAGITPSARRIWHGLSRDGKTGDNLD